MSSVSRRRCPPVGGGGTTGVTGVLGALVLLSCSPNPTLIIDPLEASRCEDFCVDRIEAVYNAQRFELQCGEPLSIEDVDPSRPLSLQITATGSGFTLDGQLERPADSDPTAIGALELTPRGAPQISFVTVPDGVQFEAAELSIIGSDFGVQGPTSMITIDGAPLDLSDPTLALSWTDTRIELRTSQKGDLRIHRCGVASEPTAIEFQSFDQAYLNLEQLRLNLTGCPEPRLINGDTGEAGHVDDVMYALFECDAQCNLAYTSRIASNSPPSAWVNLRYEGAQGCAYDIAPSRELDFFLATDSGLTNCTANNGAIQCTVLPGAPQAPVTRISVDEVGPNLIRRPSYLEANQSNAHIWLPNPMQSYPLPGLAPISAFGGLWLAGTSSLSAVQQVQRWVPQILMPPQLGWSVTLDPCDEAVLIEAQHGPNTARNGERNVAVVCRSQNDWLLFGLRRDDQEPVGPVTLPASAGAPVRLAFSLDDGPQLRVLLWTDSGTLLLVDLGVPAVLGALSLEGIAPDAQLLRTWRSDTFFMSGPGRSEVTRFSLPDP